MSKYHVIYVPGLGDSRTYGQNVGIQLWRLFGVTPHYFPLYWADKEPFQPKLDRLITKINELKSNDNHIALCGASAGASATLNAYVLSNKIDSVVWLCGKINNPQIIESHVYITNPAFKESMDLVAGNLRALDNTKRQHVLSIHPLEDRTVPIDDTKVPGTVEVTIRSKGHSFSIFYGIIFGAGTICHFIRKSR